MTVRSRHLRDDTAVYSGGISEVFVSIYTLYEEINYRSYQLTIKNLSKKH